MSLLWAVLNQVVKKMLCWNMDWFEMFHLGVLGLECFKAMMKCDVGVWTGLKWFVLVLYWCII